MFQVTICDCPQETLQMAGPFLEANAARNNVVLTLLHERQADQRPMRAWVLHGGSAVAGFAFRSPLDFDVNLVTMAEDATDALAGAIARNSEVLNAVRGPAATTARFAGAWLDLTGCGALPVEPTRILQAAEPARVAPVAGELRRATQADREVVMRMMSDFLEEIGGRPDGFAQIIDRRLEKGQYWLWWSDGEAVSLAGVSDPVAGVVRIQAAYTRPGLRNRAHASACVGTLTARFQDSGHGCVLYTDLNNPVSNHVFVKIGYRPIGEDLRYEFTHPS